MKNKRKMTVGIIILLVIIGIIVFAVLNSGRKAITLEKFEEKAKENGYNIADIQNDITDKEEVTGAKVAMSEDYSYIIRFYTLKDNDVANSFYNEQKEEITKNKQEGNEPVEKSGKNDSTYTLKSNGKYMYISKIDNTILQLTVNEAEEKKVTEFIKKLGY